MRLTMPDEIADLVHRERRHTGITSETNLITSPLDKGLDVLARPRTDADLTLSNSQIGISFIVLVLFLERNVGYALTLCLFKE